MKLGLVLGVVVAAGLVTGCSTFRGSSVSGEWSCRALGNSTCADIASNDIDVHEVSAGRIHVGPHGPLVSNAPDRPTFYGRQVLRVTLAPWVDGDGRYHAGTTIFAPYGDEQWAAPASARATGREQ
ncbi:MAG: TraV family lipoprotein [Oceanicaulis sp.]|uniref:TraV family lipoprotein n=1 Tax=Glycocaulis sp. TaxID=1969725 RepID=UPI0025C08E46|nr:TraV family lipoprotein [Glycocaulis sp.]MCC5982659.1 TraV family lipoprotein [Oceanicaulis sp.]MCH8522373.1 TraV family lipoprotein [Glycocaulis sp.]